MPLNAARIGRRSAALASLALLALATLSCGRGASGPSVLLITLDTTRADHLGCYGGDPLATPALDRLAAGGTLFERASSNVPITLPSHATILTGLLPPEHGLRVNGTRRLDVDASTLAEELRAAGYRTGAFVASFTLDSRNGLDRGFDVYDDDLSTAYPHDEAEPLTAYRPGDAVVDAALGWLRSGADGRPFFCWVHLFDPHAPYFAHQSLAGTPFAGRADYPSEIAFMDRQVERLTAWLDDAGRTGDVLVVVAGDHGEGLAGDREQGHGYMLYGATLHVPLIFRRPGQVPEGRRVGAGVSLVDLHATILDLAGFPDADPRSGRDLAPAVLGGSIDSEPTYAETDLPYTAFGWSPLRSLATPDWKYVRSSHSRLFDLRADPNERNDVAATHPDVVRDMERRLRAMEDGMERHRAAEVGLTGEAREKLASLGYVAGPSDSKDEPADLSTLHDVEDMVPVLERLARVRELGREGRHAELAALLREMLAMSPESAVLRRRLAVALIDAGELDAGIAEARVYLRLRPDDAEMHFVAGLGHARAGRILPAVRSFLEAIRIEPDNPRANAALADLLERLHDPLGALRHRDPRERPPVGALAEYDLGVVTAATGDLEAAVTHFERALAIDPDDLPSRYRLAALLEQRGDATGARREYLEALRREGDDAGRLRQMGIVLGQTGHREAAVLFLQRAAELAPSDAETRRALDDARRQAGRPAAQGSVP